MTDLEIKVTESDFFNTEKDEIETSTFYDFLQGKTNFKSYIGDLFTNLGERLYHLFAND